MTSPLRATFAHGRRHWWGPSFWLVVISRPALIVPSPVLAGAAPDMPYPSAIFLCGMGPNQRLRGAGWPRRRGARLIMNEASFLHRRDGVCRAPRARHSAHIFEPDIFSRVTLQNVTQKL